MKGKKYMIITKSAYFFDKYKIAHPPIEIEGEASEVLGKDWKELTLSNWACALYYCRQVFEELPKEGIVYYGKIHYANSPIGLGELVHETELKEI